jgi:hypothetical protein
VHGSRGADLIASVGQLRSLGYAFGQAGRRGGNVPKHPVRLIVKSSCCGRDPGRACGEKNSVCRRVRWPNSSPAVAPISDYLWIPAAQAQATFDAPEAVSTPASWRLLESRCPGRPGHAYGRALLAEWLPGLCAEAFLNARPGWIYYFERRVRGHRRARVRDGDFTAVRLPGSDPTFCYSMVQKSMGIAVTDQDPASLAGVVASPPSPADVKRLVLKSALP